MIKRYFFTLFIFFFISINLISQKNIINKIKEKINNQVITIETRRTNPNQIDIYLVNKKQIKITKNIDGENLKPKLFSLKNNLYISYINYKNQKFRLFIYNNNTDNNKLIFQSDFISSDTKILQTNNSYILFFKAKFNNNEDVFLYHSKTKKIINITKTNNNEKTFSIEYSNNNFLIHTETIKFKRKYLLNINNLKFTLLDKQKNFIYETKNKIKQINYKEQNTFLAFGDSITWGKMRMNNLEGEYHPELTYWYKAMQYFNENYGQTYAINLGIPGESSYQGLQRQEQDFTDNPATYCYIMFGTNDVNDINFSAESSAENIELIALNSINKFNMQPVLFTIPPQRHYSSIQCYKKNSEALNQLITKIGQKYNIPVIDTYKAFFEYPDGWLVLLEDVKGNHPSPTGHQVIANLIIPVVLAFKPQTPQNIQITKENIEKFTVNFERNYDFDFQNYKVVFGYSEYNLNKIYYINSPHFYFYNIYSLNPFNNNLFFRIYSVDKEGNESEPSNLYKIEFNE